MLTLWTYMQGYKFILLAVRITLFIFRSYFMRVGYFSGDFYFWMYFGSSWFMEKEFVCSARLNFFVSMRFVRYFSDAQLFTFREILRLA